MGAITNLCQSSIFLDSGQIIFTGSASEVVSKYLDSVTERGGGKVLLKKTFSPAFFKKIAILNCNDKPTETVELTSGFKIYLEYDVLRPIIGLEVSFSLFDKHGSLIFYSGISKSPNPINPDHKPGHYVAEVNVPKNFIAPGLYTITISLEQPNIYLFDIRDNVIGFSVIDTGSKEYLYSGQDIGAVLVNFEWQVELL